MRVLLVYQSVPESADWLVLTDPSVEDLNILHLAHGSFTNATETSEETEQALNKIGAFLCDPARKDIYSADYLEEAGSDFGKWHSFKVEESDLPGTGGIDKVFTCGFLM
ncbi:hypothetical protein B7759_01373 [Burkholderia glumae]|uniref:hypothetical protein n=1 Tax=Burkholderia glumae TaxID=337 RepID=UPI001AE4E73D|nr:hypothetical protein [Burkholderia glumae]QTP32795.1 hypothetical protein B7759_01373 [Burkholderia glumae]